MSAALENQVDGFVAAVQKSVDRQIRAALQPLEQRIEELEQHLLVALRKAADERRTK